MSVQWIIVTQKRKNIQIVNDVLWPLFSLISKCVFFCMYIRDNITWRRSDIESKTMSLLSVCSVRQDLCVGTTELHLVCFVLQCEMWSRSRVWPSSESQSSCELGRELAFLARYSNRTEDETEPPDSRTCRHTRPASWAEGESHKIHHQDALQTAVSHIKSQYVCVCVTRTVAAQHSRLDQRRRHDALVENTRVSTQQLAPRSRYQHLHTPLKTQKTRRSF